MGKSVYESQKKRVTQKIKDRQLIQMIVLVVVDNVVVDDDDDCMSIVL